MNVVNTSDNSTVIEPQGSAHSPQTEQASCLFYSVVHDKNMSITNLPLLKPAANHQTPQASVMENWENNNQPDWIAEPDSDHQAVVNSEFQQLLALNQELCATNTSLYAQVGQLKDELAGAEKILQWQKTRSAVTESMLTEQTQELSSAQEQIKSLSNQLEAALQTVQHQEIFLETYKSQLQLSQQRLAQLERECSLLQGNYSEQSQQLLQSESTCRELRSRLMRQQRQTLQFKVALEKCLDTPVPNYDTLEDNSHPSQDIHCGQTRFSRKARSLFPNAQPIKPWSAESESGSLSSSSWVESVLPPLYNSDDPTHPTTVSTSTQPHESNISTPAQTTSPPIVDEQVNHASEPIPLVNNSSNLDQHLESLIQMFFASQDGSVTPFNPLTTTDKDLGDQNSDEANTPVGEILTSILEGTQKSEQQPEIQSEEQLQVKETVTAHPNSSSTAKDGGTLTTYESPVNSNSSLGEANTVNDEDYWAEVSTTVIKLPEQDGSVVSASLDEYSPESRSPSPLIYPQRPPKGRKSLAAVELPNFRPLREKGSGVRNGGQGEN